jgi:glycosyltransferase involved in cell wall biosynthesis
MLESVLRQTHKNWTLVVVDNFSSDETVSIVEEYAKRDSRILLVRFETLVPVHENFARAFTQADGIAGEFVQILAGDDELGSSNYLAKAVETMGNVRLDAVAGGISHFTMEPEVRNESFASLVDISDPLQKERFASKNYWVCNLMYAFFRRDAFKNILADDRYRFSNNLSSDWWFALGVLRELNLGFDIEVVYRKYSKQLSYDSVHYGVTARNSWPVLHPILFPLSQLGDRFQLLPLRESLRLLRCFYLREIRAVFKAISRGMTKSDA